MAWLASNLLTINLEKTKILTFAPSLKSQPPQDSFHIKAHCCPINSTSNCQCLSLSRASSIKYLGVHIDSSLNWHTQLDSLIPRVRKLIPVFKKLRCSLDASTLKTVYYALAQSILSYCIVAWGGATSTAFLQLERAQRGILKVMTKKHYRYPTTQLYKDCEVLTVRQLFVLQVISRKHSSLVYSPDVYRKRRSDIVCQSVKCKTGLTRRHYNGISPRLYNTANKLLHIYPLAMNPCRKAVKSWLQKLTYRETEDLLKTVK